MDVGDDLILGLDWFSSHDLRHLFVAGQVSLLFGQALLQLDLLPTSARPASSTLAVIGHGEFWRLLRRIARETPPDTGSVIVTVVPGPATAAPAIRVFISAPIVSAMMAIERESYYPGWSAGRRHTRPQTSVCGLVRRRPADHPMGSILAQVQIPPIAMNLALVRLHSIFEIFFRKDGVEARVVTASRLGPTGGPACRSSDCQ